MRPKVFLSGLIVVVFAVAIVVAGPMVRDGYTRLQARSEYNRELEAVKRAGLPTDSAGMRTTAPPDQNAAPIYERLQHVLAATPLTRDDSEAMWGVIGDIAPDPQVVANARRLLASRSDIGELVHAASLRPQCAFTRNYALGPATLVPETPALRLAGNWLAAEGRLDAIDRRWDDAIACEAAILQVSRHSAGEPGLALGFLPALNLQTVAANGFTQMLYENPSDTKMLGDIERTIAERGAPPSLAYALRGELVMDLTSVQAMRTHGLRYLVRLSQETSHEPVERAPADRRDDAGVEFGVLADLNGAYLMRTTRRLIETAERDYPVALRGAREVTADSERSRADHRLDPMIDLPPTYALNVVRYPRAIARMRVVRCGAAVLAYRARTGSFPSRLSDACPTADIDPFTLKPLGYRREGAGFVIYSAGPGRPASAATQARRRTPNVRDEAMGASLSSDSDVVYTGGTPESRPGPEDVVFHYPMPAYMRAHGRR